ncbi:AcrR family transcriptional regulator [Rhodobacteraceae bacterium MBR-64]
MVRKTGSHADITGPRIRAAAQSLFARHGFAAVSMRQIAAAVGVQAGALYFYTPDKQSLLFDLMHDHMQTLISAWDAADPGPELPPLVRLQSFVRFHIHHSLERADAVFLSYMELRNLTPDNFARIEALRRTYEDRLESILRAGLEGGAMQIPDAKLATLALIAMLTGITTWFRPDGRLSCDRVADIYWEMARKTVAGSLGADSSGSDSIA